MVDDVNLENLLATLFGSSQDCLSTTWHMCKPMQLLKVGTQAYPLHVPAVHIQNWLRRTLKQKICPVQMYVSSITYRTRHRPDISYRTASCCVAHPVQLFKRCCKSFTACLPVVICNLQSCGLEELVSSQLHCMLHKTGTFNSSGSKPSASSCISTG